MSTIYEKCISLTARDFNITEKECDKIIKKYRTEKNSKKLQKSKEMDIHLLFDEDNGGGSLSLSSRDSDKPFRNYILEPEDITKLVGSINKDVDYTYTDGKDTFLLSSAKKTMTFNIKKNNQTIVFHDEYKKLVEGLIWDYNNFIENQ